MTPKDERIESGLFSRRELLRFSAPLVPAPEKQSAQRVARDEEPVPSETRESEPMDPAAMRDFLQQLLREAEESFPPEKRGWPGPKKTSNDWAPRS